MFKITFKIAIVSMECRIFQHNSSHSPWFVDGSKIVYFSLVSMSPAVLVLLRVTLATHRRVSS